MKIAKSLPGVILVRGWANPAGVFLTVCCFCQLVPAHTLKVGRYFVCPSCNRVRTHPPADPYFYLLKELTYCAFCRLWWWIEDVKTFASEAELEDARRRGEL